MEGVTTTSFSNQKSYRLIPSKFPPIDLYEDVAEPDQLEAIFAVEALTNPRLMEETGNFMQIPVADRLTGIPHCSYVMGAFTHYSPDGARFNSADFGAYYCAEYIDTAIKETVYHMERIMGYTKEPAQHIQMRTLAASFSADLTDLTPSRFLDTDLYHPTNYKSSQRFAADIRSAGGDGIRYQSVRHNGHECFALFRPRLVDSICQSKHYSYVWNGDAINNIIELSLA